MTDSPVRFELRDNIAVLSMDDGKANALSPTMLAALDEAFDRAAAEAKAVALFGRPGRFSAGFDLRIMMSGPEAATGLLAKGAELFMKIYEHPQPVIAGVTGHALAGGVLLAACADHRVGVSGDFKLGLNEVQIGMPAPILAHELARDRLRHSELNRSVLFAHIYDPAGAAAAGWLDEVVEGEALEQTVLAKASALAKLPALPYAKTKRSLRAQTITYIRETLADNIANLSG